MSRLLGACIGAVVATLIAGACAGAGGLLFATFDAVRESGAPTWTCPLAGALLMGGAFGWWIAGTVRRGE